MSSRFLEGTIVTYLHRKGIIVTNKPADGREMMENRMENDDEGFAGAYVKPPKPGLYEWVYSLDLQSLYPSIIMSLNISPETKIGYVTNWNVDKHLSGQLEEYLIRGTCEEQVVRLSKEAFTPYLREKLAAKLSEMDDMEEAEIEEAKKDEKEMKENFDMDEAKEMDEAETMDEADEMEEGKELDEMDLDELLRELDEMEEGKKEDVMEGEDDLINEPKGPTAHGNVAEEEEVEMGEEEDEEIDLENMSEDDPNFVKFKPQVLYANMLLADETKRVDRYNLDRKITHFLENFIGLELGNPVHGKVVASEHCYTMMCYKDIMDEYPDEY